MIDTTPTAEELAAAAEWREANAEVERVQEHMRKFGYLSVPADEHARVQARIEAAALAITIPDHLMTFNPDHWPGRSVDAVGFTNDALRKREQWRQAQDAWDVERKLCRSDFETLAERQTNRSLSV